MRCLSALPQRNAGSCLINTPYCIGATLEARFEAGSHAGSRHESFSL